ncbi:MAG: porin family protein [Chlorobiaceae bacterium]|nr:porin family protein [Chlorobiaceae bacterium]
MKKKVIGSLLLALLSASPAYANFYVRGSAGLTFADDSRYAYTWDTIVIPMFTGQSIKHGVDTGRTIFNTGSILNGAVGYDFGVFRAEGEICFQNNGVNRFSGTIDENTSMPYPPFHSSYNATYNTDVSENDISETVVSYMLNGYVDIDLHSRRITPYVMGGLGNAAVKREYRTASHEDNVFAWQVGTGVAVKVADKSTVDIGYRYFKANNLYFNDSHYIDPTDTQYSQSGTHHDKSSHNITVSFRQDL